MQSMLKQAITQTGDTSKIRSAKHVRGGSINDSFRVDTSEAVYFVKYHEQAPEAFFEREAKGLQLISATDTIRVPRVAAYQDLPGSSFLVLEWIEGQQTASTQSRLGKNLAMLHSTTGSSHGFWDNTYIGLLNQPNGAFQSWLAYYRDQRLETQLKHGLHKGTIAGMRHRRMERLLNRLGEWVPDQVKPSALHGDLWGGNWIAGPLGEPYLIDPSFLYGDRHFDLAFTELFGGFSSDFYNAYHKTYPIDAQYESVKPLYQLYYLLVHLNIFGEMYGGMVDNVLKYYVG